MSKRAPAVPPAFRPQLVPRVLQRQDARTIAASSPARPRASAPTPTPVVPPVYQPQSTRRVLQTKHAPGNGKASPQAPWSRTVQRAEDERVSVPSWRSRRDTAEGQWDSRTTAGRHVSGIEIQSGGEGEMYATVYVAGGYQGVEHPIHGEFTTGLHAEMAALQNACAARHALQNIVRIVIGRAPCHRCAVVLNYLGLSDKVTYKNPGQKEYHTWGFPNLSNWGITNADLVGLDYADRSSTTQGLGEFSRTKWW